LLKGTHWPPFGNAIISSQKFTYITYIWALVFACLRHNVSVILHAHLARGESYIQRHAYREVATKDTRINAIDYSTVQSRCYIINKQQTKAFTENFLLIG